jgi:hypothetical protein
MLRLFAVMSGAVPTIDGRCVPSPRSVGTARKRAPLPTLRKDGVYAAAFSRPRLSEAIASSMVWTSPKME